MHAPTPALVAIDPRGLALRTVAYHRRSITCAPQVRITHQTYSAAGRASHSRDPRLFKLLDSEPDARANLVSLFSLSGNALLTDSVDAGWRLSLAGEAGQTLESWDSKLNHSQTLYDTVLRPAEGFEQAVGESRRRSGCFYYGDASDDFAARNQCGQLIRHDDTTGTQTFSHFSLTGKPLAQALFFLKDYQTLVHWPEELADRDLLLEPKGAGTSIGYDAIGDVRHQTDGLGNTQSLSHTIAGQLREVQLTVADRSSMTLVSALVYNAFGHMERQTAGNGVTTTATYCAITGRLEKLTAKRMDQSTLQDLSYRYDPVGNVLDIKDSAQPTRYFRNQRVEALNTYEYDTLYQLIHATGRQAINGAIGPQLPPFQSPADPGQLENYTQTFSYDAGGNLHERVHTAVSHSQTRRMGNSKYSNRSLPEKPGGELPTETEIAAGFDANGNLKALQPGQPLGWNIRNQLSRVEQVAREDGLHDAEIYIYDGSGQRRRKIRTAYTGTLSRTHEVRYLPGLEFRTGPEQALHVITVQAGYCNVQLLIWDKGGPSGATLDQPRYSLTDHLGSSTLVLDSDAALISQEWFYAYGGTACWAGRDEVEANYKTLRYSGKERDATGLYYYGYRYYAPWLQRWINPDPAGTVDGLNLFAFVGNNPSGNRDGDGLTGWDAGEFLAEFDHHQANRNLPTPDSVVQTVDESARIEGSQVLALGLENFSREEQQRIVGAVDYAARALRNALIMVDQHPVESRGILHDFFGPGTKSQMDRVRDAFQRTLRLLEEYETSAWGPGRLAKLSQPQGSTAVAEADLDSGAIILFEKAFTSSEAKLAAILIHEISHFGEVDSASTEGPETDDYWYLQTNDPRMSARGYSAEAMRHSRVILASKETRKLFNDRVRELAQATLSSKQVDTLYKRSAWIRTELATRNADSVAVAAIRLSKRYTHLTAGQS